MNATAKGVHSGDAATEAGPAGHRQSEADRSGA